MEYNLHLGESSEVLKDYPDNHFHSVVCDPPYLINFLGKGWDGDKTDLKPVFEECLRVLKPGGYLLAFSSARTYHKTATMIEDVGFEIKDMISWIYSSGFPKGGNTAKKIDKYLGNNTDDHNDNYRDTDGESNLYDLGFLKDLHGKEIDKDASYEPTSDVAKQWDDYSTNLKPSQEPICLARKPTKLSTAANCLEHGVGSMNIGACRIPYKEDNTPEWHSKSYTTVYETYKDKPKGSGDNISFYPGSNIDNPKPSAGKRPASFFNGIEGDTISGGDGSGDWTASDKGRWAANVIGEIKGYEKYFYHPKVSSSERALYMSVENKPFSDVAAGQGSDMLDVRKEINENESKKSGNIHPTMKPIDLMKYLCRLVTPKGGIILDPFMGSGSTGMAAAREGFDFVGIEMNETYYNIAEQRVSIEYDAPANNIFGEE
jgi:site-specific DNA-methyltransferase (adenine-specific)